MFIEGKNKILEFSTHRKNKSEGLVFLCKNGIISCIFSMLITLILAPFSANYFTVLVVLNCNSFSRYNCIHFPLGDKLPNMGRTKVDPVTQRRRNIGTVLLAPQASHITLL